MRASLSCAALLAALADAQQLYFTTDGYTERPQCTQAAATPQYHFRPFSYTLNETVRFATSVPAPTTTRTYAPPYSKAVKHLTTNPVTTTWGNWLPNQTVITATDTDDPYGQAAWSSLWQQAELENYTTTGLYSTTVSPTAVPTSELVLPPREYFGPTDCYNFPDGFIFGVAGSAAQVEGAMGLEGRSPTIQEKLVNTTQPKNYVTNENYYLYKQDIQRLAAMGVKYYSFSIPWTRILPFVLPGSPVNEQGVKHYDNLINTVLDAGMQPIVTLLHFDSPLMFVGSDNRSVHPHIGYYNGGYQNETFVDAFVNYAKIVLTHYADRVPIWVTFNEPFLYSFNFAGANNVVHAHAQVYHFYHEQLNATGKMGIKLNDNFGVPRDPTNSSDIMAANRFQEIQLGLYANPIFLGEQYPDSVLTTLPGAKPLSDQDLSYIGNTSDFFGVDPYTATVVSQPAGGIESCAKNQSTENSLFPYCVIQETKNIYGWNIGYRAQSYVYITPTYLREYVNYLWNTFRKPVFVTEFGLPVSHEADQELSDQLFDTPRSIYYLSFMSEILKAIHEDGVHVMGALAWSWADNWEFGDYKQQFGLQVVNRTTQQRFFKKSFFDLIDFVGARLPSSS
ncbi:glycoside hydrolase superfamily [Aspergillus pseudotamarii]|uniref:Glycoside hydrolase superfamily n=1 Tax=Aspergillus pseudotamarii TaxID=132259 RepID=A0A5N6SYT1_ASPPS|nr:glycoside hydrolase superfamily [Aspergillus pseudotamarii]KAE8139825.1 glycoside hydrolase superfamily [Aspergillus pseudotamarii]